MMHVVEATNVNGVVMTSSPGPTPRASRLRNSPLVPLLTATARRRSIHRAKAC
jgi:hypothetical protein